MSHVEEYEILDKRAREFLAEAKEALEHGRYDLACFFAEQAAQLYLKAILLKLAGEYPRTYQIRTLLSRLAELLPDEKRRQIVEFMRSNRARLSELEDVYVMARYSTKSYTREDAEDLVRLVVDIINMVEELVRE